MTTFSYAQLIDWGLLSLALNAPLSPLKMNGFHGYREENHKRPQFGMSCLLIKSRRDPVDFD